MATETESPEVREDRSRPWTVRDVYERFPEQPDDSTRYEVVDGVLYVTPAPRARHQIVIGRIIGRMFPWTEVHGGLAYPVANVDLDDATHLEPDVVYTTSSDPGTGLAVPETPALVVEVSSPSTKRYDRTVKLPRYERQGIPETWLVDLDAEVIEQSLLGKDGRYGPPAVHRRGERFTSPRMLGLTFHVDDLLGPPAG